MEVAGEFNSFYNSTQIVNKEDAYAPYKVALVSAFVKVMNRGLWLLGIQVPKRM
jgi:arginyl-tRNA synthetase